MGSALVHKAYCFGETIRAALGIEIKHYIGVILHKMEGLHSSCGKNNGLPICGALGKRCFLSPIL